VWDVRDGGESGRCTESQNCRVWTETGECETGICTEK
jgi:hypothetical protein